MAWHQTTLTVPPKPRGFHLITGEVKRAVADFAPVEVGVLHVFIRHTSASLTINENADPDVRVDFRVVHQCYRARGLSVYPYL